MSDPPRLIGSANEFERSLLGAWETRQPQDAARTRTLAALGVVAVGAGTAAAASAASGSMAPKAVLVSSALLKWVGIGVGLVATVGVVGYATFARVVAAPAPAIATAATSPSKPDVRPVPQAPPPHTVLPPQAAADEWFEVPAATADRPAAGLAPASEGPSLRPAVVAAPSVATGGATAATAPAAAPVTATLDEEVYAVDQARRALTAGNAAGALQLVDAYDAKYPTGALAQESVEIRIEGLFGTGKRALATKLGARFLAAHPESPYAREIRALMAAAPSP